MFRSKIISLYILLSISSNLVGQEQKSADRDGYSLFNKNRKLYGGFGVGLDFTSMEFNLIKAKVTSQLFMPNAKNGLIGEIYLGSKYGNLPAKYKPFDFVTGVAVKYQLYLSEQGLGNISEQKRLNHLFGGLMYNCTYNRSTRDINQGVISIPLGINLLVNGRKDSKRFDTYLELQVSYNFGSYEVFSNMIPDDNSYCAGFGLIFMNHKKK